MLLVAAVAALVAAVVRGVFPVSLKSIVSLLDRSKRGLGTGQKIEVGAQRKAAHIQDMHLPAIIWAQALRALKVRRLLQEDREQQSCLPTATHQTHKLCPFADALPATHAGGHNEKMWHECWPLTTKVLKT